MVKARGGVCRINADAFSTFLRAVQSLDISIHLSLSLSLFPFFPLLRSLFNRATLGIATVARFGDDVYTFFFFPFFLLLVAFLSSPSPLSPFVELSPTLKKTAARLLRASHKKTVSTVVKRSR